MKYVISVLKPLLLLLLFFTLIILTGCSTSSSVQNNSSEAENYEELEELYWSRVQSSRMSFTQADVDFMVGMIGHHAQALIMSDLAPENGASQQIQTLAARITNAQKDEINSMQNWLRDRDLSAPEIHIEGLELIVHGADHSSHHNHTNMPGMLSDEQLKNLSETRNEEFDKLFLEYMIQHHKGAVTMVDSLFSTDGAAQDEEAFRLAADIHADQVTEINRMELMLSELTSSE